ncbi:carbohydrate ABC transporter permease [Catellatospora sp. TT07R-123]|uniref:carbohydrate ABC transporter permease n=1 Tax=Catellatospora sp. TT07R-123 TaxID=2733863 RepID=UPI001FD35B0B|nr:carbohydrate ABC transporter permease [Catellatospora sp. TT07R-123]
MRRVLRGVYALLGIMVAVVWVFPVYWMATTAIKPGRDMYAAEPQLVPLHPTMQHINRVLHDAAFWQALRNSAGVTAVTVVLAMAVAFLSAVAVARFDFGGRRAFLASVLVVQLVPHVALIIPLFLTLSDLGLADTLTGLVVAYLAFALPFAVWTMRGFVAGVPRELEEAAMIDGCTPLQAFRRVTLPLVLPGLIATSIFTMILSWNEYLVAYFLTSTPDRYTLPLWLTHFITSEGAEFGPLMAGSTLIALPVAICFALAQRNLAHGLTAGAVKG